MTFLSVSTVEVSEEPFSVACVVLSTAALKVTSCFLSPPSLTSAEPVPPSFTVKPACSFPMFVSLAATLGVKPSMAVVFFLMLPSLVVTRCVNFESKPTVTVGLIASPSIVTVVSPVVPRNWMFGVDVLLRVKFFLVAASAPLIENCVEMLLIGIPLLLMLSMILVVICCANLRLSTPYLMVAPLLLTVSP